VDETEVSVLNVIVDSTRIMLVIRRLSMMMTTMMKIMLMTIRNIAGDAELSWSG
jgi:hypothetical protein